MGKSIEARVGEWLLSNDTGASSRAIVSYMMGAQDGFFDYPRDPSDLGRCIRLLAVIPEYHSRLHEMGRVSPTWKVLIDHWDELVTLYAIESPLDRAPECFKRMQELIEQGRKAA